MFYYEILTVFVTFFIIMDPFASGVYFLGISKKFTAKEKSDAINFATLIAGVTLIIFLVLGPHILNLLGISVSGFQIAGGIVLLVVALKFIMGTFYQHKEEYLEDKQTSIIIIGVPLITGPGVLTTTILMSHNYGFLITFIGAMIAIFGTWLFLKLSDRIYSIVGERNMEVFSRVFGLLLAAIAVEMMIKGLLSVLNSGTV